MTRRQQKTTKTKPGGTAHTQPPAVRHIHLWAAGVLIAVTVFAYAPVRHFGFVNYDDPQYVSQNPYLTDGLTWHGITWAFTTGREANWHPLTWLSHLGDVQLYGLNAGPHHVTNLALHIANALLLFALLFRMTQAPGRSLFVAALFAVHPLHVESVAWVAERKDVLSTLFWMLTLWAYILYVGRPQFIRYLVMLALFAMGLMAKPMLVTLPFVLLLLDLWPLGRWGLENRSRLPALIREKVPLLVLAAASSVITMIVQRQGGAMVGVDTIPVSARVANACIAYFTYLQKMFWPVKLAVLYPAAQMVSRWWLAAAAGLVLLTIFAIWSARRRPYIAVGWFWYLGTLVPVIGLIQVGRQAMADRYTYVPLIGLFLVVAFGVSDAISELPGRQLASFGGAALAIAACIWMTSIQLQYWRSSPALWEHTIAVTGENALAHFDLGAALEDGGQIDQSIGHYYEALRIEPDYADAHYNLANALTKSGKTDKLDEAIHHLTEALRINPTFAEAQHSLGVHYLLQGKLDEALGHLEEAIRLKPDYAIAHNTLATALGTQGKIDAALVELNEAVRLDPAYSEAHSNLGILLARQGKTNDAVAHLSEALRINSDNQAARSWLIQLTGKDPVTR